MVRIDNVKLRRVIGNNRMHSGRDAHYSSRIEILHAVIGIDKKNPTIIISSIRGSIPSAMISSWIYPQYAYIQRCRQENKKTSLKGKHVLVIGGTQGIGAGPPNHSPSRLLILIPYPPHSSFSFSSLPNFVLTRAV